MSVYNLALVCIWAVFLIVWITSAATAKRGTGGWGGFFARIVISIVVLGVLRGPVYAWISTYSFVPSWSPAFALAGDILAALGIAFAVWARVNLGRNWGMPMSTQKGSELVTSGPYTYVRHPIYTGVMLALLGTALVLGPLWIVLPFIYGAYFVYSAKKEEERMLREFPNEYPAYRARTRFLIPFVW